MFHSIWKDVEGRARATMLDDEDERSDYKKRLCPNCFHSKVIHARHGGCHGQNCLCGWDQEVTTGALIIRSSGTSAADINPGRKRNRGARISDSRRANLLRIPCYFCGDHADTIDHLIARAKGGTNDESNLVSACAMCNAMKSDKSYEELIAFCLELQVTECRKTSLRHLLRVQNWKAKAQRILAWHESRIKSKEQVPVV